MDTATRMRVAAACCVVLGIGGAALLVLRGNLAGPALPIACLVVALVGVLLYWRADGAAARRPGW